MSPAFDLTRYRPAHDPEVWVTLSVEAIATEHAHLFSQFLVPKGERWGDEGDGNDVQIQNVNERQTQQESYVFT
jgi:hypothetical protein